MHKLAGRVWYSLLPKLWGRDGTVGDVSKTSLLWKEIGKHRKMFSNIEMVFLGCLWDTRSGSAKCDIDPSDKHFFTKILINICQGENKIEERRDGPGTLSIGDWQG